MEKGCVLSQNLLQKIQTEGNVVLTSLARFCNCTEAEILEVLVKRNQEKPNKTDVKKHGVDKNLHYGYTNYMKQNGKKKREISIPCKELKKIQEIIKQRLSYIPVSLVATAGNPGDSAQHNADMHRYNQYLITMDIKNAYPSIDTSRVYKSLLGSLYKPLDTWCPLLETKKNKELFIRAITHLCVNNNTLPQGASTSSKIQNIVMRAVDINIEKKLPELTCSHIIYSRYADDITISFASFTTMNVLQEKMTEYQTLIEQSKKTDMTNKQYIDDIMTKFSQDIFVVTDKFEMKYLQEKIEEIKNKIKNHPKLPTEKKYEYIGIVNHYKQQIKYSGWRIDQVADELLEIIGQQGRTINLKKLHTRNPQTTKQREINGITFDNKGRKGLDAKKKAQFKILLNDLYILSLEEIKEHGHYKVKFNVSQNQSDKELITKIKNTLQGVQNYLSQIYNEKGAKENNIPSEIQQVFALLKEKWDNYERWKLQDKAQEKPSGTLSKKFGGKKGYLGDKQQKGERDEDDDQDDQDLPF